MTYLIYLNAILQALSLYIMTLWFDGLSYFFPGTIQKELINSPKEDVW
jgi:hypothetical protein